jgi:hypothetical protein
MVSNDDTRELFTSKTNASDIASSADLLSHSSTQISDKIMVSDDDPGELFTSKTDVSDVASSVDLLSQSSTQISDKIMVSDDDPRELITSKTDFSDVASSVDLLSQSSTQITDKITVSFNDPGELFTSKTDTSDVASSADLLSQSPTNVTGVIDYLWKSNAVLMTAKIKGVKIRVLIYKRNFYINRQRCTLKNKNWQQLVQGKQVYADVSELKDHPSGAVYKASSAWLESPCDITYCRTEKCVNCTKKTFSSDVDPSTSGSKVKSGAGKQKSKHSKTNGIRYPTENTGTCREKPMLNDKSCSVHSNVTASSDKKLQVRDKTNGVKVEKPLYLNEPMLEANTTASLYQKDTEFLGQSDKVKADKPLCQEGTVCDEIKIDKPSCREETFMTTSSGNQQLRKLPVTSTPHTGLAKQLKEMLGRVKGYKSSMRGILECFISGAVLEIDFDRSVVKFFGQSEVTDMIEHLPVDSTVYFDGEVVGEDSLLGCSDIVVTSVSQSEKHRKLTNSRLTHSLLLELEFPSLHEGLVTGRTYEGIVTKINPPRAFVATVTEDGKTYDVFVFNTFFSPAEYGAKLPVKHSVLPFIAKGYKVHLIVERTQEVNSKYTYKWFAVDAWTEAGDNDFRGSKHKTLFTSEESDDHQEGVMNADHHDHLEGVIDVDHHNHQAGVIMTLYPEWGVLNADHLKDEVTFFARDAFLFGVRLTSVDLREVFRPGKSHSFIHSFIHLVVCLMTGPKPLPT